MELNGKSIIGQGRGSGSEKAFYSVNAATGERLEPAFHAAAEADLERAMALATAAFPVYRGLARASRAGRTADRRRCCLTISPVCMALPWRGSPWTALPPS